MNFKRILTVVLAVCLGLGVWAQQQSDLQRAQRIYDLLKEAQGDSVMHYMNDQVRAAVSAQMLGATFAQLQMQMGELKEVSEWQEDTMYGVHVYYRDLTFEKAALRLLLAFDADGRANTLRFVPVPKAPAVSQKTADQVPDGLREKSVEVCTGSFKLPGTLTMPLSKAVFRCWCWFTDPVRATGMRRWAA